MQPFDKTGPPPRQTSIIHGACHLLGQQVKPSWIELTLLPLKVRIR